ncbi:hypothetical protein TIFTF001_040675 [Ficus carica]|uniref:Uncharacterized protein n=1 Tax=Ficus carica TaxID=3494 RepID=A0AA87YWJ0_FICCA|nr:hypothetical protein TIFTF001_040675 [Ficus carica]
MVAIRYLREEKEWSGGKQSGGRRERRERERGLMEERVLGGGKDRVGGGREMKDREKN